MAQVAVAHDQKYIQEPDYEDLTDRCRRISSMLGNLIGYSKQFPYHGTKYKKAPYKSLTEELNELLEQARRGKPSP